MDSKTKTDRQFELLDGRLIDIQGKLQSLKRDKGLETAVNNLATQLGAGLQAIALALSTPQDNSAEVREQIKRLDTGGKQLQQSIDQFNKET